MINKNIFHISYENKMILLFETFSNFEKLRFSHKQEIVGGFWNLKRLNFMLVVIYAYFFELNAVRFLESVS
jgi:hypothetical protein